MDEKRKKETPISLDSLTQELMSNDDFRAGYENRGAVIAIAKLIKAERLKAKLTQAMLAKRIGSSQPEIVRLEAGTGTRGMTAEMLKRVADACNVEAFVGFGGAGLAGESLIESLSAVLRLAKGVAKTAKDKRAVKVLEGVHNISTL